MGVRNLLILSLLGFLCGELIVRSLGQSFSGDVETEFDDYDSDGIDEGQHNEASGDKKGDESAAVPSVPYKTPSTDGLYWVELFEEGWSSRWENSANPKFTGRWETLTRSNDAIQGDRALTVMDEAKHHGISARFPRIETNLNEIFAIQYEALFENTLQCGGAYMKLFDSSGLQDMSEFDNETPYVIMFGPDRCGSTNKVHFIYKIKNPKNGEWSEHHLSSPPVVPSNQDITHLYRLIVRPDNTFAVEVDNVVAREGSLFEEFHPALQIPDEIEDLDDKKPDDWVNEAKIADPSAVKPDDWDEDEPAEIPDDSATMPEDWLTDEPRAIPDPDATMPDTWDEEDDGTWEAPLVPNPKCASASGCGPWMKPKVPNPNYWGPWKAPLIDNPAYKGIWTPRKIPNPNYFKLENPHALYPIDAIGFELWTIQNKLMFDNIVIARDLDALRKFTSETWEVRHGIEKSHAASAKRSAKESSKSTAVEDAQKMIRWAITEYPVPCASLVIMSLLALCGICMRRRGAKVAEEKEDVVDLKDEKQQAAAKADDSAQTRQRVAPKKSTKED